MSTKELLEKATVVLAGLSDKALVKLIELLDDPKIRSSSESDDEAMIEEMTEENRGVLARLAK